MTPRVLDELIADGEGLRTRGEPMSAESLLREAVRAAESRDSDRERSRGLPAALNALGMVCKDLANYDEGRALYERALAVLEKSPETAQHDIATLYHNLGGIEHARGNYQEAERLARQGVEIRRRLGNADDALAADLVALAAILDGQRRFEEAEEMYVAALSILERAPERNRAEIAVALNNLGSNYLQRGRTTAALVLLRRSEEVKREFLGPGHPDLAMSLNNLAVARKRSGDLAAAKRLYHEALEIFEAALGKEHPKTLTCRNNLSTLEKLS